MADRSIEALHRFSRSKPNVLYHFTEVINISPILERGIDQGNRSLQGGQVNDAPWLTMESSFFKQVWAAGHSSELRPAKTGVRFKIEIPVAHLEPLRHWLTFAQEQGIDKTTVQTLASFDGGMDKAALNWLYLGTVRPEWITETRLRDDYRFGEPGTYGTRKRVQLKRDGAVVPSGLQIGRDVSISRGASDRINKLSGEPTAYVLHLLARHRMGDYGDLDPTIDLLNKRALREGRGRVVSQYPTPLGGIHVATVMGPSSVQYRTLFVTPEEDR